MNRVILIVSGLHRCIWTFCRRSDGSSMRISLVIAFLFLLWWTFADGIFEAGGRKTFKAVSGIFKVML